MGEFDGLLLNLREKPEAAKTSNVTGLNNPPSRSPVKSRKQGAKDHDEQESTNELDHSKQIREALEKLQRRPTSWEKFDSSLQFQDFKTHDEYAEKIPREVKREIDIKNKTQRKPVIPATKYVHFEVDDTEDHKLMTNTTKKKATFGHSTTTNKTQVTKTANAQKGNSKKLKSSTNLILKPKVKPDKKQRVVSISTNSAKTPPAIQAHSQLLKDGLDKVSDSASFTLKQNDRVIIKTNTEHRRSKIHTGQDGQKRKREDVVDDEMGRRSKYSYVSSIFSGNPEAPYIYHSKITQRKEKIFASGNFQDLSIHPFMLSNLESAFGVTRMTTVQKIGIPSILEGRDVLLKSQTGSGKTLAYAIPIIQALQSREPKVERSEGVLALIIVPTRELALQSYECFQKLVKSFTWIVPGYLVGGEKKKSEKSRIRKGINVLISTPGRLIDHLEHTSNLSLKKAKYLVLDEADRLLDMGYERDVSKIIGMLNEQLDGVRQTLMLSATLTTGVERLAGLSLTDPVIADAVNEDEQDVLGSLVTPEKLTEYYLIAPMKLRLVTLSTFIMCKCQQKSEKLLVFFPTQDMVDFHTHLLSAVLPGFVGCMDPGNDSDDEAENTNKLPRFFKLHGNMSQTERTQVFKEFRQCRAGVLMCTDVAARGLDLPSVHWIVQYNAPSRPADYVHRVGRTARIGESGRAVLFLLPTEAGFVNILQDSNISLNEMPVNDILDNILLVTGEGGINVKGKGSSAKTEHAATDLQLQLENFLLKNDDVLELARKAFHSYVRFYASYSFNLKNVFHYKSLHLGHVAKSMALRETPSQLGCSITASNRDLKFRQKSREATNQLKRQESKKIFSEYESGLENLNFESSPSKRQQSSGNRNKVQEKRNWKVSTFVARRGKHVQRRAPIQ